MNGQAEKPVYYGPHADIRANFYVKSAAFPLIPQFIVGTDYETIMRVLKPNPEKPAIAELVLDEGAWFARAEQLLGNYFTLEKPNTFEPTYRELHLEMDFLTPQNQQLLDKNLWILELLDDILIHPLHRHQNFHRQINFQSLH